jgi:hypothetical protein
MGSFNNYLELAILDHVFSATAFNAPATLYIGLSTTAIQEDGTGITEPAGGSYARVAVTNNDTNWPLATLEVGLGTKNNGTAITFPQATGAWGTVVDFFIADAAVAGNILCYGTLDVAKAIESGDIAEFAINAMTITLD